jgi:hypothetical protein
MKQKVFCGGYFCRKLDRRKCYICKVYVCGGCSLTINKKYYCIDCGIDKYIDLGIVEIKKELKR